MTHGEILTAIMGYRRREQAQLQAQSLVAYRQAHLLGQIIGNMFDSNCPVPSMTEAFPGVFSELEQEEQRGIQQQDWRLMKARIEEFRARQQAVKRR
jgi:hypothetical protein